MTNIEDDVLLPPRKPHNMVRKRAVKKLKVSEDTRPEVGAATIVVEYPLSNLLVTICESRVVAGYPLLGTNCPR
jgi:hypothetical protein